MNKNKTKQNKTTTTTKTKNVTLCFLSICNVEYCKLLYTSFSSINFLIGDSQEN